MEILEEVYLNQLYVVTIKTNFWHDQKTVTANSQETAIAKAMVLALHDNHNVPSLAVKEVKAVLRAECPRSALISEIDSVYFNQAYSGE